MKLISLNIESHRHLEERVLPFLLAQEPDLVCLQEVFEVDVDRIKSVLRMEGQYIPMANVTEVNEHIQHAWGSWGILQLSRLPIKKTGHTYYQGGPEKLPIFFENNDSNSMNRVVLIMEIIDGDQSYRVATTHFIWSTKGESTPLQLEKLTQLLSILAPMTDLILCGDFNAPRGKETFARLAARYQDNIPPDVETSIDGTFHKAGQLMLMVDGLFTTPEYQVSNVQVLGGVSDHKAVVAEIQRVK